MELRLNDDENNTEASSSDKDSLIQHLETEVEQQVGTKNSNFLVDRWI